MLTSDEINNVFEELELEWGLANRYCKRWYTLHVGAPENDFNRRYPYDTQRFNGTPTIWLEDFFDAKDSLRKMDFRTFYGDYSFNLCLDDAKYKPIFDAIKNEALKQLREEKVTKPTVFFAVGVGTDSEVYDKDLNLVMRVEEQKK